VDATAEEIIARLGRQEMDIDCFREPPGYLNGDPDEQKRVILM
jgi:hypothetical protein